MTQLITGTHIMLDLETMDNRPSAAITAIGALVFTPERVVSDFYMPVDLTSSMSAGGTVSGETIKWWLKQGDDARGEIVNSGVCLEDALTCFSIWVASYEADAVWGNGAGFDNVILRSAYESVGKEAPWPFWKDRCFRTLKNLFPGIPAPERAGTHHNALDDAEYQMRHLLEINAYMAGDQV